MEYNCSKYLRVLRHQSGLKQKEVSALSGLSDNVVSHLERGLKTTNNFEDNINYLSKYVAVFDLTLSQFFAYMETHDKLSKTKAGS